MGRLLGHGDRAIADALHSGVRLIRQLGRMVWDRLLGTCSTSANRIPGDLGGVDAAWLSEALQPCFPGVGVRDVQSFGAHSGTTTRGRIRPIYSGPIRSGGSVGPPETLFVKITPRRFATRLFTVLCASS